MKSEQQAVMLVNSSFDMVTARLQVRELARKIGFDLRDQASIALAIWSIASTLGLGSICPGQIIFEKVQQDEKHNGVRVTCVISREHNIHFQKSSFNDAHWIVDELDISDSPGCVEIKAIKWKTVL